MMATKASTAKKKATVLHSRLVRARGACENCAERDYTRLQCAHVVSRRYSATRTDLANAFCLCAACHMRFTEWPLEFAEFVLAKKGESGYAALVAKSQSRAKVDWISELDRLRELEKSVQWKGVA